MTAEWSSKRVATSLVADARGLRDKAWVLRYLASRQRVGGHRPLAWMAPTPSRLSWHSSPSRLAASVEAGGLSSWYEIAHRMAYAPTRSFHPQPGWVVVDVGANIGAYSAWAVGAMKGSGTLLAIEPNPVSFERLVRTLEGVSVKSAAMQIACGDIDADVALHFEPGFSVSSSVRPFASASQRVNVRMRRLDDIVAERAIEHLDILKIDVEGAEELVLRGASITLLSTDRVILETTADIAPAIQHLMDDAGLTMVHEQVDHWGVTGLRLIAFERSGGVVPSREGLRPSGRSTR